MKDPRLWEEVIGKLSNPLPGRLILLTASPQRSQPEVHDMGVEPQQSSKVCRHCMVGKEARDDLLEPLPLLGDRPMHTPSQFSFDLLEFRLHAVMSRLPMDQERSSA